MSSTFATVPCPCLLCQGKLVTPYVRRKHTSSFTNIVTDNEATTIHENYMTGVINDQLTNITTKSACTNPSLTVEATPMPNFRSAKHVIEGGMKTSVAICIYVVNNVTMCHRQEPNCEY